MLHTTYAYTFVKSQEVPCTFGQLELRTIYIKETTLGKLQFYFILSKKEHT